MSKKRARKAEPSERGLSRKKQRKKKRGGKEKSLAQKPKPGQRGSPPKRPKRPDTSAATISSMVEILPASAVGVPDLPATPEGGKARPGECVDADRVFEAWIAIPLLANANRRILDAPQEREEAKKRAKAAFENLPAAPTRELADAIVRLEGYAKSGYVPQQEATDEYSQMQRDLGDLWKWQFDLRAEARMLPFAAPAVNIQLLKEQQEEWKQGAAQIHDVQARIALGLNADHDGAFRDDQQRSRKSISGATLVAPLPREEIDGSLVYHPDSPTPKPWAYFEDDQPDLEHSTLAIYGSDSSRDRYMGLAGSSWRLLESNRVTAPLRLEVDRSRRFLPNETDWVRWTLLLFRMVWGGRLPASVQARKWLWLTDTHRVEADKPLSQMLIDQAMRLMSDAERAKLDWTPTPGSARDYAAVLEPDLFTVSAVAIGAIVRACGRSAIGASAGQATSASKTTSPKSKSSAASLSAKQKAENRAKQESQWRVPQTETRPVPWKTGARWMGMKYRNLQKLVNRGLRACRRISERRFVFDLDEVLHNARKDADPAHST